MRKPGAMPGSAALEAARAAGAFTAGPRGAVVRGPPRRPASPPRPARLIGVLLLHRHMDDADVIAGIGAALSVGAHTADVVAVEARKVAETRAAPGGTGAAAGRPTPRSPA